jgi:hypothetical protein
MRKVLLLAITAAFGGCAAMGHGWSWYKDGATQQDFEMDQGQCKAQAFSVPNASMLQVGLVIQNCMIGKGWVKRDNP